MSRERASFSAVARDLEVTQSAVSRAISALEKNLGVRLVSRSTRSVSLTEAGQQYYVRCRQILSDINEADSAVGELNSGASGSLSVAAPVPFDLMFISPRLVRFKVLNPGLSINIDLNDLPQNLVEQNIDVAIRLGHLTTPGLVARKLGNSPIVTVAAPSYLAVHGTPNSANHLDSHPCLVYAYQVNPTEWHYVTNGVAHTVTVNSQYKSNNLLALKDATLAGLGIARLPLWMVDAEIKSGMLNTVLNESLIPPLGIHAVFPSARQIPAKVRTFVEFMQNELSAIPYFLADKPGRPAGPP